MTADIFFIGLLIFAIGMMVGGMFGNEGGCFGFVLFIIALIVLTTRYCSS